MLVTAQGAREREEQIPQGLNILSKIQEEPYTGKSLWMMQQSPGEAAFPGCKEVLQGSSEKLM